MECATEGNANRISVFFRLELVINWKDQQPKRDMARDYEQFTERKCKWLLNF